MHTNHGIFTVSLDFELYWGVRDKRSLEHYQANLLGVRKVIPALLQLFAQNDIHATWATVGFLFFRDRDELQSRRPTLLPGYTNAQLSPYHYLDNSPALDADGHFAPQLIELIRRQPGQDIGTHTLSHYYCLEPGQTRAEFEADLRAAIAAAERRGIAITSLVFPRNQRNRDYLETLEQLGIKCFRGNESGWMYKAAGSQGQNPLQRILRLLDSYLNISGPNTYTLAQCKAQAPFDFPASRFLRPWSKRLAPLDGLRLRRIKRAMDEAAANKRLFHLWWHPHNFGVNLKQNLDFLGKIIEHYRQLQANHGMRSMNMAELCQQEDRALAG